MNDAKLKFQMHRANAKKRGIAFSLTFEEWWDIWKPYWADRGRGRGKKSMCRIGDTGGYELGNVYIATAARNARSRAYARYNRLGKDHPRAEPTGGSWDDSESLGIRTSWDMYGDA